MRFGKRSRMHLLLTGTLSPGGVIFSDAGFATAAGIRITDNFNYSAKAGCGTART